MNTLFTPDRLRALFQNQFNSTEWLACLQHLFQADELRIKPEPLDTAEEQGYYWGAINTPDHYHIGLFHYVISHGSVVNRRVGLRKLVEQFTNKRWGDFDAALVVFSSRDHWRLSLICDIDGEATSPKRFTYVFGSRDLLYRTPIERFTKLQKEGITFAKMREAFSVEALSDEFFERYREQYADFVQYVTGKRYVKVGNKWEERVLGQAHAELISAFRFDEKRVRDYIKKMMGRITFLHFLQRKGWMCGDLNYMQHLFERSPYQDDYLDTVLEPLFFGILNTRPEEREALFTAKGWNQSLLGEWKFIPYLNGGLFECEAEDLTECRFPVAYFRRLFQFFSEYNFTIDENDPTDAEVGVDPEMLGKIFENLLEDNKDKGAFYTPKEIVRYMCRESLIAYLVTQSMERGNTNPREKVEASIRDLLNKPEEIVPRMNERQKREFGESLYRLKICDPAIGSGAFPMGLLNELVRLRALIDAWAKDDNGQLLVGDYAALKSEIICNNIYGVDIERGAIDIARLRFWLSIVVDEVTPHTLPNLDYKFMQGNSLITTFNGEYINLDSKQEHANIVKMRMEKKRLYQLKQQYYTATGEQKHQLNVDIKDSILSLIALQLDFEYRQWFDHHNTMHYLPGMGIPEQLSFADIKQNLPADKQRMCDMGSSLRRQLHDETKPLAERAKIDIRFFDWRMMFTEVFEGPNPGFDIVIGNPPYINVQLMTDKEKNLYKELFESFFKRCDIFALFIEIGLKLSSAKGIVTFIVPSVVHSNLSYQKLRNIILDNHWLSEVCYTGGKVFNAPTVDTTIIRCNKSGNDTIVLKNAIDFSHHEIYTVESDYFSQFQNIISIGKKNTIYDKLFNENFIKIESAFTVFQGIVTGNNTAFVFDSEKDAETYGVDECLLHPLCHGRDIGRYEIKSRERRILYIDNSVDMSLYPYTIEWLWNFKEQLDKRREVQKGVIPWYGLQWPRVKSELDIKEKILIQRTRNEALKQRIIATLDDEGVYGMEGIYFVFANSDEYSLRFLLGILNSKLMNYLFATKFLNLAIKAEYLKQVRIPTTTNKEIVSLVDRILTAKKENLQADTSALEAEIDQLVYQLYGLTDEEIAIIEKANE